MAKPLVAGEMRRRVAREYSTTASFRLSAISKIQRGIPAWPVARMLFRQHSTRSRKWSPAGVAQDGCVVRDRPHTGPGQTRQGSSRRRWRGESRIPSAGHRGRGEGFPLDKEGPEANRRARRKFEAPALLFPEPEAAARYREIGSPVPRSSGGAAPVRFFPAGKKAATRPADR